MEEEMGKSADLVHNHGHTKIPSNKNKKRKFRSDIQFKTP